MSKLIDDAIDALRRLPEDMQEAAARTIIDFANQDGDVEIDDEQVVEIERRMAEPNRTFMTLDEARGQLRHLGA